MTDKMNKKTLVGFAFKIEAVHSYLEEDWDAMNVLRECLERDGFQTEEHFNDALAINFVIRFPCYLSLLDVIWRDLGNNIKDILSISQDMHEASHAEKEQEHEN